MNLSGAYQSLVVLLLCASAIVFSFGAQVSTAQSAVRLLMKEDRRVINLRSCVHLVRELIRLNPPSHQACAISFELNGHTMRVETEPAAAGAIRMIAGEPVQEWLIRASVYRDESLEASILLTKTGEEVSVGQVKVVRSP